MRVRLTLDDGLVADAKEFTGIVTTTVLLHVGLKALVEREAAPACAAWRK